MMILELNFQGLDLTILMQILILLDVRCLKISSCPLGSKLTFSYGEVIFEVSNCDQIPSSKNLVFSFPKVMATEAIQIGMENIFRCNGITFIKNVIRDEVSYALYLGQGSLILSIGKA